MRIVKLLIPFQFNLSITSNRTHYIVAEPLVWVVERDRQRKNTPCHLKDNIISQRKTWESCTAERYPPHLPPLPQSSVSVATSLCISRLPWFTHSFKGTHYLPAKRPLGTLRPQKGSLAPVVSMSVTLGRVRCHNKSIIEEARVGRAGMG